jgi:hypothetical protein
MGNIVGHRKALSNWSPCRMPNDANRSARGLLHLGAAPETLAVIHALRDW